MLIILTLITKRTHFNPSPNSGEQQEASFGKKHSKTHSRGHKKELFKTKHLFTPSRTRHGGQKSLLIVLLWDA